MMVVCHSYQKGLEHMDNYIKIEVPYISESQEYMRLSAETVWCFDGQVINKTLFFEVEKKWGAYLTCDRSDAFVLALLELAMEKKCDIEYQAPLSETLKYQLEQYLITVCSRKFKALSPIKLIGETTDEVPKSLGVAGTGFSGGVDSFYSILSHLDIEYSSKRVTHVLLAVNGAALTGMSDALNQEWFEELKCKLEPITKELGVEFICVNSNISLLIQYKKILKGGDVIITSSFVHALRKLYGTYYWASGYEADILEFSDDDGCLMEPFAVPLMSVEGLRFYHSGCEVNRVEKVSYIADNPIVQKSLTVCGEPENCGYCVKCLRTMTELYSLNKLENFDTAFNVREYKKHLSSKIARELAMDHPPFTTDILTSLKRNNIYIPIATYFKKIFIFTPYYFFKKKFRNNKALMKLWYEKGWSERLGEGKRRDTLARVRMEGKGK